MSYAQLDDMPLRYFYNYIVFLEQMVDAQEKQIAKLNNR